MDHKLINRNETVIEAVIESISVRTTTKHEHDNFISSATKTLFSTVEHFLNQTFLRSVRIAYTVHTSIILSQLTGN